MHACQLRPGADPTQEEITDAGGSMVVDNDAHPDVRLVVPMVSSYYLTLGPEC